MKKVIGILKNMLKITKRDLPQWLDDHEKWLKENPNLKSPDLRSASLISADLRGANLKSHDLRGDEFLNNWFGK